MNYRHAFHAGNFADVLKHIVLVLVISHLKRKDTAFRVVDTHAGTGHYDLAADEATRTGEWRNGIARLLNADRDGRLSETTQDLLRPYLEIVLALNGPEARASGDLDRYPGSAEIARRMLRPQDRLIANELHPTDAASLRANLARDKRVKVLEHDGWQIVKSVLPPKERRGVVLLDPPFEVPGEFERLERALSDGTRRFAGGIYILWYPIKADGAAQRFVQRLAKSGQERLLMAELDIRDREAPQGLNGSGVIVHNPPFGLEAALRNLLPELTNCLQQDEAGRWQLDWLAGETSSSTRPQVSRRS